MKITTFIKAQAGKVRENALEIYAYIFVSFGLPLIAYIYIDWKASLTTFIIIQAIIGVLAIVATLKGAK